MLLNNNLAPLFEEAPPLFNDAVALLHEATVTPIFEEEVETF